MDIEKNGTACFTGHRRIEPPELADARRATENAVRELMMRGFWTFLVGGALGFDALAQRTVLAMREEFPFVRVVMAIPCADQDARWNSGDRAEYRRLLETADERIVLNPVYTPSCMRERNRFMVDHSAVCVAYYDGRDGGGTASTVRYAKQRGVPVWNVRGGELRLPI